jgi:hypothetical protein
MLKLPRINSLAAILVLGLATAGTAQAGSNRCMQEAEKARVLAEKNIERKKISNELRGALTQGAQSAFAEAMSRCEETRAEQSDGFSCAEDIQCQLDKIDAIAGGND